MAPPVLPRLLPRLLARLLAVVLASAGAMTGVAVAPASAEVCSSTTGVSVVVDYRELGGGAQAVCDGAGGGRYAWTIFEESGFDLREVARQPGFVCQVNGLPADQECRDTPPQNAYWGLFWSDGTDGSWTYSSMGARSLRIPAGGSVAFAWQGQRSGPPDTAPPVSRSQEPSPSTPTTTAGPRPSSSPSSTPSTSPSPSASTALPAEPTARDEREARRLRREADRRAQQEALVEERREARAAARREAAGEARAERRREARQDRRERRTTEETAEEQARSYDDPPAAATDDAAGSQVPTWATVLVLVGMALLALLLAALRRRAARAG